MSKNSVPNQRNITIKKEPCDKKNRYTINNLEAIDGAAVRLQSKAGFKLYIYLAKNQDKYNFDLPSSSFLAWAGVAYTAYTTAFKELVDQGYLVLKPGTETVYTFYDKPKENHNNETIKIENPKAAVDKYRQLKEAFDAQWHK